MFHLAPDWDYYWGEGSRWLSVLLTQLFSDLP